MCENCTLMLWSKDGNQRKVNDCGEHPGVMISFKFKKLHDLVDIELWDLEEPTFIELYGPEGELLKNISAPGRPDQDGNPAVVELLTNGVTGWSLREASEFIEHAFHVFLSVSLAVTGPGYLFELAIKPLARQGIPIAATVYTESPIPLN